MMKTALLFTLFALINSGVVAFVIRQPAGSICSNPVVSSAVTTLSPLAPPLRRRRTTSLPALVDVPDHFFTATFPVLGILLSFSRNAARVRLEERAWEQRVAEAQEQMLREDESLTELDLRRQEAENEWSAYGKQQKQQSRERVAVATPAYDPYYDEPYPEDELPEDRSYSVDRLYGDRIYEDGEIFYKDADSGMYYRQGCKPRGVRFFRN